jgi:hypothetical protein
MELGIVNLIKIRQPLGQSIKIVPFSYPLCDWCTQSNKKLKLQSIN